MHNVLKEAEAQALALATNRTGSEMLQELLGFSPLKPLCRVLAALRSNWRCVACHRCGVHVLQSALLQLPRLLGSCEEEEEEAEEEKEPPLDTLEELVLGLASEVCDDFLFYCGDTHGSFVVRTLLQVLGGTLLESERARHRGSRSPGEYYKTGKWAERKGEFRKFRGDSGRRVINSSRPRRTNREIRTGLSRPKISVLLRPRGRVRLGKAKHDSMYICI